MTTTEIDTPQLASQAEEAGVARKKTTAAPKPRKSVSGQFAKGTSGNPSGRPPGSRNHATLLMESLLEGEAEQLTRKVIELAKAGDLNALRLCLERLIPPRKDRTIHLVLPPIENVQQICLAMARVAAAVGEGEITPTEGEVLSNILVAHKTVLMTGDLGRRMDELEQRMAKKEGETAAPSYASGVRVSNLPATAGGTTNLANRLNRLERLLGPPPPPISRQVADRALATAFSIEELTSFEDRLQASGATSLVGIFAEGTTEHQEVLRRLEPALDKIAQEMAGKSFADLLREEAGVNAW